MMTHRRPVPRPSSVPQRALVFALLFAGATALLVSCGNGPTREQRVAIEKWADALQPSSLDRREMIRELEWFAVASRPFRGLKVRSVAEDIKTHVWESKVLTEAFKEITGIEVEYDIISEGEVVDKLLQQMNTNRRIYDIYVNDADLTGTHLRSDSALDLTEYMAGEGADVTNPYLDLPDFLNLEFGQDYDGHQLQLPDQQFANLYWFRYDWFSRPDLKREFKAKYGYELGVPLNWEAYEDIAEFFTGRTIDGRKVYGHMDYGKKSPSLGWRFTDAWLSMAGVGDVGLPNGTPVDEWGIRVEGRIPVGASVSRGGEANGPAAVYALTKYIEWLKKYAPSEAIDMTWDEANVYPANGTVAQAIFEYTNWLSDERFLTKAGNVTGNDGKPLWRVAPSPHGKYWDEGMKIGYQDSGSWTILKNSVKGDDRKAAWLWAQFCVSKSVCLKKFLVGFTPIRKSTVNSAYLASRDDEFGGLVTFYRSPIENRWTDSGLNVPHYPLLSQLWWRNIATAVVGETTPQESMDKLAAAMDELMGTMKLERYSPRLNPVRDKALWLSDKASPKRERPDAEPRTMEYEELIKMWR